MFGNLINNRQLKRLIEFQIIEIEPFNEKNLSTVHYTLHADKIKKILDDGKIQTIHYFREDENPYILKPNEYVIIEILEQIKLNDDNIVGQFIPSSNLINEGALLISGKIDKRFGNTGKEHGKSIEKINFGLKNLLNSDIQIKPNHRIAHLELFDLRGLSSDPAELSEDEIKLRLERLAKMLRPYDDGVYYDEDK